jgi:hypothetical protein
MTADYFKPGTRVQIVNPDTGNLIMETTTKLPAVSTRKDIVWVNTPWAAPATYPVEWVHRIEGEPVYVVSTIVDAMPHVILVTRTWSVAEQAVRDDMRLVLEGATLPWWQDQPEGEWYAEDEDSEIGWSIQRTRMT